MARGLLQTHTIVAGPARSTNMRSMVRLTSRIPSPLSVRLAPRGLNHAPPTLPVIPRVLQSLTQDEAPFEPNHRPSGSSHVEWKRSLAEVRQKSSGVHPC